MESVKALSVVVGREEGEEHEDSHLVPGLNLVLILKRAEALTHKLKDDILITYFILGRGKLVRKGVSLSENEAWFLYYGNFRS